MRLTRTYVDSSLAIGTTVSLPTAATHHLLRVLRLPLGAELVLFNGNGNDYRARICAIEQAAAKATVLDCTPVTCESPLSIVLGQGIARGEKMDLILQKATELGVQAIAPVHTERTEVRLDGERSERRRQHWQGVLAAACEQCGRARLPALGAIQPLPAWVSTLPAGSLRLSLDPDGELDLAHCPPPTGVPVILVVGPEGGLSARDRDCLRAAGFRGLRLGPRVLRTETAGLAAVTALQTVWGDLRGGA